MPSRSLLAVAAVAVLLTLLTPIVAQPPVSPPPGETPASPGKSPASPGAPGKSPASSPPSETPASPGASRTEREPPLSPQDERLWHLFDRRVRRCEKARDAQNAALLARCLELQKAHDAQGVATASCIEEMMARGHATAVEMELLKARCRGMQDVQQAQGEQLDAMECTQRVHEVEIALQRADLTHQLELGSLLESLGPDAAAMLCGLEVRAFPRDRHRRASQRTA